MKTTAKLTLIAITAILAACTPKPPITLSTLLDEMTNMESAYLFPDPLYTTAQVSSYDRRSVAPDQPGWFANHDGGGYVRLDTIAGRVEKVLFEADGPGAVTRIWMTTTIKNGTMRFYFDGNKEPEFEIQGYDMQNAPFYAGDFLSLMHCNYLPLPNERGGNTFMLPLPYKRSCRITFQEPNPNDNPPRYYHINYRTYPKGTPVETFTVANATALREKIDHTNLRMLQSQSVVIGKEFPAKGHLESGETLTLELPEGECIVRTLYINVHTQGDYARVMRSLVIKATFDGKQTVWAPLSDFCGSGMGAPSTMSWYIDADGEGGITSGWPMPYRIGATIEIENLGTQAADVALEAVMGRSPWTDRTLYFHASWRQQRGIPLGNDYDSNDNLDWNFITLQGRGVLRGDLLTLYNYAPDWYGEGDEKIWVDDDKFPSHFGTGTEDYYNCSWAPVITFRSPFGGAPRADEPTSHGFNTFFRTRNLDGIPFNKSLRFDIEMLSWHPGTADYATTTFWYGDYESKAIGTSSEEEVLAVIPQ